MKIRRIILLVLLAAGSVFLLSSCDALLDAIFSNNTITVYVSAYIPYNGYFPYDLVSVTVTGPTPASGTADYTGNDGYYMYWSLDVPKLSDGNYSVRVDYYSHAGNQFLIHSVSLPDGSNHSVNLSFAF